MVRHLADMLHIKAQDLYCVGDHANDIGMLRASAIPFAPANAIESVHQVPGIHILPDARDGAIAAMIRELEQRYNVHLTLRRDRSIIIHWINLNFQVSTP